MPIPRNAPELLTRRPATRLRLYIHTMFPHIHAHISHPAPLHVSPPPATIRAHTHNLLTHTHPHAHPRPSPSPAAEPRSATSRTCLRRQLCTAAVKSTRLRGGRSPICATLPSWCTSCMRALGWDASAAWRYQGWACGCVTRGAAVQSVGLSTFGMGHGAAVGGCLRRRVWA
jgi:hypothetical protein